MLFVMRHKKINYKAFNKLRGILLYYIVRACVCIYIYIYACVCSVCLCASLCLWGGGGGAHVIVISVENHVHWDHDIYLSFDNQNYGRGLTNILNNFTTM